MKQILIVSVSCVFCFFTISRTIFFSFDKSIKQFFLIEKEFVNYFYDKMTRKREGFDG